MAQDIILTVGGDTRPLENVINRAVNQKRKIGSLDVRGFEQPLGRITGKASEFQKSLEASNARVIAFGASAGMIFSVQTAMSKLVESTIEVEKALTDINVLLGMSSKQMSTFSSELFEAASRNATAFADAATAAGEFARQGLSASETIKRTSDALTLSRLSGLDFAASVQAMTAALNSFGKEALTTTEIVDRMAAVDAAFAVSSADLAEAIRRVASSADSANVSLNETIAVVTAAQQITARGGAKIGNAFKTIFTRLQRPRVLDQLRQIGVETKNAAGATLPLMQVLQNLANKYDLLTESQRSYISEQIGSVYQINILKATMKDLGGEMSLYSRALETAENSMGSSERRTNELNTTLSSKLVRSLNSAKQAAAALGKTVIAPTLGGVADVGTKLFDGISKGAEKGESKMGRVAQGALKGLGAVLQGPGLQALVSLGIKLFGNLTKFIVESGSEMGNFGQEAKNVASIQESILAHLKENPEVLRDITNGTLSVEDAHSKIIDRIKDETTLLQQQLKISRELAVSLSSAGVKTTSTSVEGEPEQGLPESIKRNPLTLSRGFAPAPTAARAEIRGAIDGGYGFKPGAKNVIDAKTSAGAPSLPGIGRNYVMNAAEKVSSFTAPDGSLKNVISPGGGSALRDHDNLMMKTWGISGSSLKSGYNGELFARGFVPNFEVKDKGFERKFKSHFADPKNLADQFFINVGAGQPRTDKAKEVVANMGRASIEDLGNGQTKVSILNLKKGSEGKVAASFTFSSGEIDDIKSYNIDGIEGNGIINEEDAVQYVKELAGFNAARGETITITSPNGFFNNQFLGIGRESIAFEGPETEGLLTAIKEPLRKVYPNIKVDPGTGQEVLQHQATPGAAKKFETRHDFLTALQDEGYNILGENVRFPKRLGAEDGRYLEENVYAEGGEDFLQMYNSAVAQGKGKETLGAIQFYLQQIQQEAYEKLGLQGGMGGAAFPNLDPRSSTIAAHPQPEKGMIKKMTDNVLVSSLQDVENLQNIISGPAGSALASYSDGFEKIRKAQLEFKAIPEANEQAKNKALEEIKKLEETQRAATANIATQFPELNNINRIVLDFETSLSESFTHAPDYTGGEGLSNKLNEILAGRKSVAVSEGFIPNFLETKGKKGGQGSQNIMDWIQGGEELLGKGKNWLSEKLEKGTNRAIPAHLAKLRASKGLSGASKGFIPSFAAKDNSEIVDKLAMLIEGGNIATAQQLFNSLGSGNESLGDDLITGLYARLKNITTNIAEIRGVSELEQVRGEPSIPTMIGVNANMEGSRRGLAFLNQKKDNPFYKKNAEQIDLLDRGIRIREALGIQTGSEYLGASKGHGVTGTGTSNPKFLNKPGEAFPGTDLPVPLNPNLVDPEIQNLPPLPGTIDESQVVKYHHQDPHDYPWLGKGVSKGYVPNFIDPLTIAELASQTAIGGSMMYAGARSAIGDKFNPFGIEDTEDPEWMTQLASIALTDLDDLGSIPNKFKKMIGKNKSQGYIPNFLKTKSKKAGQKSLNLAELLPGAAKLGKQGISAIAGGAKNLLSGAFSGGFVPNMDDVEVLPDLPMEKYDEFVEAYRAGVYKDSGVIGIETAYWQLLAALPKIHGQGDHFDSAGYRELVFVNGIIKEIEEERGKLSAASGFVPNYYDVDDVDFYNRIIWGTGAEATKKKEEGLRANPLPEDALFDSQELGRANTARRQQFGKVNRAKGNYSDAPGWNQSAFATLEPGKHWKNPPAKWTNAGKEFAKKAELQKGTTILADNGRLHLSNLAFHAATAKKAGLKSVGADIDTGERREMFPDGSEYLAGGFFNIEKDLLNYDESHNLTSSMLEKARGLSFSRGFIPNFTDELEDEEDELPPKRNFGQLPASFLDKFLEDQRDEVEAATSYPKPPTGFSAFSEESSSRGFVPNFADYILQGADGSEIARLQKKRDSLTELQKLQAQHPGSHIFSSANDGLTDQPILSKGFTPNFFPPFVDTEIPEGFGKERGIAFFDSDWIGNRSESTKIVDDIVKNPLPYHVFHGPAGAGKTTLARSTYSNSEVIEGLKEYENKLENDLYEGFIVMSGTGRRESTGKYTPRAMEILKGASQVTAVDPDDETVMERRINRIKEEKKRLHEEKEKGVKLTKEDTRDLAALKATRFAPLADVDLYEELSAEGIDVKDEYHARLVRELNPEKYDNDPKDIYKKVKKRLKKKAEGFIPNFISPEPFGGNPGLKDITDHMNVHNFADYYNTSPFAGTGDRGIAPTGSQEGTWAAISSIYRRIAGRDGNWADFFRLEDQDFDDAIDPNKEIEGIRGQAWQQGVMANLNLRETSQEFKETSQGKYGAGLGDSLKGSQSYNKSILKQAAVGVRQAFDQWQGFSSGGSAKMARNVGQKGNPLEGGVDLLKDVDLNTLDKEALEALQWQYKIQFLDRPLNPTAEWLRENISNHPAYKLAKGPNVAQGFIPNFFPTKSKHAQFNYEYVEEHLDNATSIIELANLAVLSAKDDGSTSTTRAGSVASTLNGYLNGAREFPATFTGDKEDITKRLRNIQKQGKSSTAAGEQNQKMWGGSEYEPDWKNVTGNWREDLTDETRLAYTWTEKELADLYGMSERSVRGHLLAASKAGDITAEEFYNITQHPTENENPDPNDKGRLGKELQGKLDHVLKYKAGTQPIDIPESLLNAEEAVAEGRTQSLKDAGFETGTYKRWEVKVNPEDANIRKGIKQLMVEPEAKGIHKYIRNLTAHNTKGDIDLNIGDFAPEGAIAIPHKDEVGSSKAKKGFEKLSAITDVNKEFGQQNLIDPTAPANWKSRAVNAQVDIDWFNPEKLKSVSSGFVPNFRPPGYQDSVNATQDLADKGNEIAKKLLSGNFNLSEEELKAIEEDKFLKRVHEGLNILNTMMFPEEGKPTTSGLEGLAPLLPLLGITQERDEELDRNIYGLAEDDPSALAQAIVDHKGATTEGVATKAEKDKWIKDLGKLDVLQLRTIGEPEEQRSATVHGIKPGVMEDAGIKVRHAIVTSIQAAIQGASLQVVGGMNLPPETKELLTARALMPPTTLTDQALGPVTGIISEKMVEHLFLDDPSAPGQLVNRGPKGDDDIDVTPDVGKWNEFAKEVFGEVGEFADIKGISSAYTQEDIRGKLTRHDEKAKKGLALPRRFRGFVPNFSFAKAVADERKGMRKHGAPASAKIHLSKGTIGGERFIMNAAETEIPNFGRNGDSAVIPNYGQVGKDRRKELYNKSFFSGHIPSFAKIKGNVPNFATPSEALELHNSILELNKIAAEYGEDSPEWKEAAAKIQEEQQKVIEELGEQKTNVMPPVDEPVVKPAEELLLHNLKVKELKEKAKSLGMKGYSGLNKANLVQAILDYQKKTPDVISPAAISVGEPETPSEVTQKYSPEEILSFKEDPDLWMEAKRLASEEFEKEHGYAPKELDRQAVASHAETLKERLKARQETKAEMEAEAKAANELVKDMYVEGKGRIPHYSYGTLIQQFSEQVKKYNEEFLKHNSMEARLAGGDSHIREYNQDKAAHERDINMEMIEALHPSNTGANVVPGYLDFGMAIPVDQYEEIYRKIMTPFGKELKDYMVVDPEPVTTAEAAPDTATAIEKAIEDKREKEKAATPEETTITPEVTEPKIIPITEEVPPWERPWEKGADDLTGDALLFAGDSNLKPHAALLNSIHQATGDVDFKVPVYETDGDAEERYTLPTAVGWDGLKNEFKRGRPLHGFAKEMIKGGIGDLAQRANRNIKMAGTFFNTDALYTNAKGWQKGDTYDYYLKFMSGMLEKEPAEEELKDEIKKSKAGWTAHDQQFGGPGSGSEGDILTKYNELQFEIQVQRATEKLKEGGYKTKELSKEWKDALGREAPPEISGNYTPELTRPGPAAGKLMEGKGITGEKVEDEFRLKMPWSVSARYLRDQVATDIAYKVDSFDQGVQLVNELAEELIAKGVDESGHTYIPYTAQPIDNDAHTFIGEVIAETLETHLQDQRESAGALDKFKKAQKDLHEGVESGPYVHSAGFVPNFSALEDAHYREGMASKHKSLTGFSPTLKKLAPKTGGIGVFNESQKSLEHAVTEDHLGRGQDPWTLAQAGSGNETYGGRKVSSFGRSYSGYVPNFQGIGAGAEMSLMLGAFGSFNETLGELNDSFNQLTGSSINLFDSQARLKLEAAEAAQSLATFQGDFIEKPKEDAGLTGKAREEKKEELVKGMMADPSKAYQQAAVRETAVTKLTGTQEYEDASTRGRKVMEDKEAGRLTELMAKPKEELEGDDAKDYAAIVQRGKNKAGEIGATGIETPKALAEDAETKTKAVDAEESKLSALKEMLGTPAATETTPPSTAISEVVKESGTGAAKSGIDKAVFHIDSAILNIKEAKKAAEKKDTAAPAPASATAEPGEGDLKAKMREKAEKKVAERHGERGPLDDDQKEDLKEEVEAQIKIEIKEEIKKIEGTTDEKGETLTKGTLTEKKDERDTAIKADEELKQGMAQAADDNLDAQTRTLEEVEIEQADVQPIIDAAEEAAERLSDIGKDVGEGSLQYKEQEKVVKEKEKAAEQAQGWVGQKRGDVQRGLVREQRQKQEKVDVKKQRTQRSAKAGKLAAGMAFAGTAGIETMMGPEASDAKTAALSFAKGATEAGQIMAAVPGPVGVALGAMKGLTTVAEGLIEFKSGIATVRKEAEIQKQHFQETNSALTEYSQALNDLTNSYGDPTVTQKTIDRLNKKMEDAMSGMPNTKEAQQIKAEIQSAATPEQKQRAVANAQDLMARTQAKSEQSVNFAEMGLKRDKTSGVGGAMIGLFGGGGGWSEGGGRMFDKRGLLGGQSKAQAIDSKETLRKATTQFMGNMTAQEATGVESIMDSGAGPMAAIDQMEEMGIMSSEMADALRENAEDAADFINSLDRMVDVRKREKEVAREMARIREQDISKINQLKGAAQSVQAQMDNLAATLVTMNQIRVTKQLKQGERSTDISAAFGRRGGTPGSQGGTLGAGSIGRETHTGFFGKRTTFDPSGAAFKPQGQTGKPDMVGNVARAAMLAEGGRGSVNELFYGDESVAAVEDAAEMNRLEENRQTGSEQIRNQAQREVGEAAAGAFNADKLINTITGPDGAKKVVDEQQAKNMAVGSAIVQEQVAKAQKEGMGPKETANAIKAGMQDAAIKESIEELKKEGKGDDDPQVKALNEMAKETSKGQAVEGAKLTSQLKGDTDKKEGSAVAALQELDKAGLDQQSLAAEQKMVEALDGLNVKALEDIQIAKKNQIEAAKTREAMRNIKAGGGIAAFKDRGTERKMDRDMRRSAMQFATSKDPVRRGRAAAQLGKQVQDMVGGGMGAAGKDMQNLAIEGNTKRLEDQFSRQIKNLQRARSRTAAGSDERGALDGMISTLEKGRNDAAKIAAAQVKADQKLQEMPFNVEKQVKQLEEINAKLAETRNNEVTVNAEAMAASMKGPIEAQTTALIAGMQQLQAAMEKINQESQKNVDKQAKQQAAMSLVKEATMLDKDAMGFEQSEKLKEAIASGDTDKITAAASEASAHLAKNKDQLTGDQKKEIRGFQETAGVGNTADRNAVKTAQASVEKAQAEVATAKQGGDPDEIKKAEAKLKTAKTGLNKANYDRSQNMRKGDSQHNLAEGSGPEANRDWGQAATVVPALGVTAAVLGGAKKYGGQAFDWAKRKTGLGKPGGASGGGSGGGGARGGIRGAIDKFRGNRALSKTMDGVKGADKLKAFNVAKQAGQTTPQALKSAGVSAKELTKLKQADKLAQGGKAATQAGKAGAQGAKAGAQAAKGLSAGSKALGALGKVAVPVSVALNALDLGKLILNPGEMTANFEKANANAGGFTRALNGMSQPFTAVATNFKIVGQTAMILSDASKQAAANLKKQAELTKDNRKGRRIRAGTSSEYEMGSGPAATSIGEVTKDMLEDNKKLKEQGMDDKELTAVSAAGGLSDEQKGKIEKAKVHATSTVGAAITQAQKQVDEKTEGKRDKYAKVQDSISMVGLYAEAKGIKDRDSIEMGDVKDWVDSGMKGAGEEWEGNEHYAERLQAGAKMEGINDELDYAGLKDLNNDLAGALDATRIEVTMKALEESFKAGGVNMEAVLAGMGTDLESLAHQLTGDKEIADQTEKGLEEVIGTSITAEGVDKAGAENLKKWEEQSASGKFDAVADLDKQIAETEAQGGDATELKKERATRVKNIRDIQSEKGIDAAMQYSTLLQKRDDEIKGGGGGVHDKVTQGYDAAIEAFGVDEGGEAEAEKAEKTRLEAMRAQGHGGAADQIEKNKAEREEKLQEMKDLRMEGFTVDMADYKDEKGEWTEGGEEDYKKASEEGMKRQEEFGKLQDREQQLKQQNVTMQQEAFADPAVAQAAQNLFSADGTMAKQTGDASAMMDPNKTTPVFVTNWPGQNNDLTGRVFGGSIEGGKITSYGTPGTEMYGQNMGAIPGAEAGMGEAMVRYGHPGPSREGSPIPPDAPAALAEKISLPGGIANVAPGGLPIPPLSPPQGDMLGLNPDGTPYRPDMAPDVEAGLGGTPDPLAGLDPTGMIPPGEQASPEMMALHEELTRQSELLAAQQEAMAIVAEKLTQESEGAEGEGGGGGDAAGGEIALTINTKLVEGKEMAAMSDVEGLVKTVAGVKKALNDQGIDTGKEEQVKNHAGNTEN